MSKTFLKEVHQTVIDTLHPHNYLNENIYHVFVTQKADALLMDEQSMKFFEQQLNITPKLAKYACSYVRTILVMLINAEISSVNVGFQQKDRSMLQKLVYELQKKMDYLNSTDSKIN